MESAFSSGASGQHKRQVASAVDRCGDKLVDLSQQVRDAPELGFQEFTGQRMVADFLRRHGLDSTPVGGTGLRTEIAGGSDGPTIALLGELDAVHVPTHPGADPQTGAAHACGHHASLAAACGATVALGEVLPALSGRLVFMATPAEELSPHTSYGQLPTGKAELIRLGAFDDVDAALMVHTGRESGPRFSVGDTLNGAVRIHTTFHGTAAHSGSSPWLGVDAVRAARLAMDALDAQQFAPEDAVRIAHRLDTPTAALGAVPAEAELHVLVRGRSFDALRDAVRKVDRALYAGATAVGAGLTRTTELQYAPLASSTALDEVVRTNATEIVGPDDQASQRHLGACTDMGDLGLLMPVSHPYASGAVGHHHSPSFHVVDHTQAVLEPAKYLAAAVVDLLTDDAKTARRVLASGSTHKSRSEYLRLRDDFADIRDTWPTIEEHAHE